MVRGGVIYKAWVKIFEVVFRDESIVTALYVSEVEGALPSLKHPVNIPLLIGRMVAHQHTVDQQGDCFVIEFVSKPCHLITSSACRNFGLDFRHPTDGLYVAAVNNCLHFCKIKSANTF